MKPAPAPPKKFALLKFQDWLSTLVPVALLAHDFFVISKPLGGCRAQDPATSAPARTGSRQGEEEAGQGGEEVERAGQEAEVEGGHQAGPPGA